MKKNKNKTKMKENKTVSTKIQNVDKLIKMTTLDIMLTRGRNAF